MPTRAEAPMTVVAGVGYVGRRLLTALPAKARLGLSRTPASPETQALDLDDEPAAGLELPSPCQLVYTVPPHRGSDDELRLKRFLRLLREPPLRIVYLSTSGVYGDCEGRRVDELSATNAQSPRARRRVDAEQRLFAFREQNGTPLVILRVPGIYGPGRLGLDRLRNGEPMLDERDANPGNRIHVDDLVACCIAALAAGVPSGIYNVGDGDERSSTWFAGELARQAGLDAPPVISRDRAEATFSERRLSFLRESRRLDLAKMHALLGVTAKYTDAADGIAASLKEESRP